MLKTPTLHYTRLLALTCLGIGAACADAPKNNADITLPAPSDAGLGSAVAPADGGVYVALSVSSGQAIDVPAWSSAAGTALASYTENDQQNQQFRFKSLGNSVFALVNAYNGLCVDYIASTSALVVQQPCVTGSQTQSRTVWQSGSGYGLVNNASPHNCLELANAGTANGTPIDAASCNGQTNQQWTFKQISAPTPPATGNLCTSSQPALGTPSGKTYYVSPQGNDSSDGLSTSTPWKTLAHLKGRLASGDRALLQGGATFNETMYFGAGGISNSNEATPIFISTYGTGRATLQTGCGGTPGLFFYDAGGFEVSNLTLVGCATQSQQAAGISTWGDDGKTHSHIYFNNLDISNYNTGFQLQGGSDTFSNLAVMHSTVHDSQSTGIYIGGGVSGSYIGHNEVFNIRNGAGYGIYFFECNHGLAEYNVVHDIGGAGSAYGQGLATQEADSIVLQYNEAYNIQKGANHDQNGIIIDAESTNTLSQYNYLHDSGMGISLASWSDSGPSYTGNVVRYNLLVNNGVGFGLIGMVAALPVNADVYSNTVVSSIGQSSLTESFYVGTVRLYNNAFIGAAGASIGLTVSPDGVVSQSIAYNGYDSPGAPYSFNYLGKVYSGLAAFRQGSGQEGGTSKPVGVEGRSQLNLPTSAPVVGITRIDQIPSVVSAYRLPSGSPFVGAGANLKSTFGIDPGPHDFWCAAVSQNIGG